MLPALVSEAIAPITGAVASVRSVGGGDVSHAARLDAERGTFFLKWNADEGGDSFGAEADGLAALAAAVGSGLVVPEPLASRVRTGTEPGFLLLPWLEPGRPTGEGWARFGRALASLHRAEAPGDGRYGWPRDAWIGSKPQRGGWTDDWPAFFGEKRLLAQAETVRQRGAWRAAWDAPLARLVARLGEILPARPAPALVHGDLWAGNALALASGRFALIDPAAYVGDRETDLAMAALFGGFAPAFFEAYDEAWPLAPGADERRDVYQLFHRINHLTHGPGYAPGVEATLRRFA